MMSAPFGRHGSSLYAPFRSILMMAISVLCQLGVGSYHLSWHGMVWHGTDGGVTDEPIHAGNRVGRGRVVRVNYSFTSACSRI